MGKHTTNTRFDESVVGVSLPSSFECDFTQMADSRLPECLMMLSTGFVDRRWKVESRMYMIEGTLVVRVTAGKPWPKLHSLPFAGSICI